MYRLKEGRPKVRVLSPLLRSRTGDGFIPHVWDYGAFVGPCVFFTKNDEWTTRKKIAKTIVPWTELWLFYYELWLGTGTWHGGGIDHEPVKRLEEQSVATAPDSNLTLGAAHG